MIPEFATHTLPRLSTAIPSGAEMPPPLNGDPASGVPSGASAATVSLLFPVIQAFPPASIAIPKGALTPIPVKFVLVGIPLGNCVTLSLPQFAIQMFPR